MVRGIRVRIYSAVFIFVGLLLASIASAQTKVVVIPMAGDDLKPLANIVTVAKSNGDFDNIPDALTSITDASANKPYLIVVAPGVYTLASRIIMKPYVNLSGSGIDTTIVKGSFTGNTSITSLAALLSMSDNASVSHMTFENNANGSTRSSVVIRARNVVQNVHLRDIKVLLIGARTCQAIFIDNATVGISRVEANAIGCNNSTSLAASRSSHITVNNSRFVGSGGSYNYGILVGNESDASIRNSYLEGKSGVDFGFGISGDATARVSNSSIVGGVAAAGAGTFSCIFTDDGQGNGLSSNCN